MWRHPTLAGGGWEDTGQSLALFGLLQQQREDLAPQAQRALLLVALPAVCRSGPITAASESLTGPAREAQGYF